MALVVATIETAVIAAVKQAFKDEFGAASSFPAEPTEDEIADAMAIVIAAGTTAVVNAIKNTADLTGVTSGSDTVAGGVN